MEFHDIETNNSGWVAACPERRYDGNACLNAMQLSIKIKPNILSLTPNAARVYVPDIFPIK